MSDSTFIDLHEQMQSKGWIPDWEFNETIDLYKYDGCTTIGDCQIIGGGNYKNDITDGAWIYHLGSLTSSHQMFYNTNLVSFSGDLTSLSYCYQMFYKTPLESFNSDLSRLAYGVDMFSYSALASFNGDLPKLTNGSVMFYKTALESFNGDLSRLTSGYCMFYSNPLTSFNGDLPSLTYGKYMFYNTALTSFSGDLSKLTDGYRMFSYTHARNYTISYYKMVKGEKTLVETPVTATGLKSFNSDLSSLKSGYHMFGNSSTTCSPLDEESIMIIADTINDITSLDKSVESDWEYTYHISSSSTTASIESGYRGILHLGYDKSITDTTGIMNCCDKIAAKGWTVYLNAALHVSNNDVIETIPLTDENGSPVVIPYYYKPVQVTNKDCAEFVDSNGKFYIIVGGQHVFGDDISTYGIFTSYEHAVNEISLGLGLTPYEKPDEEEIL